MKHPWVPTLPFNFELLILTLKWWLKKIAVFLLGKTFHESVLDEVKLFILLHAQENNNRPNFPYWKYSRFDLVLLDNEVYKAKRHFIFPCFWSSLTIKSLNYNVISSIEAHVTLFKISRNHKHIFAIVTWRKLESKFKYQEQDLNIKNVQSREFEGKTENKTWWKHSRKYVYFAFVQVNIMKKTFCLYLFIICKVNKCF